MIIQYLGTSKLQGIEQIRDAWETEGDAAFAHARMALGIYIEYATESCEAVVDLAESLLRIVLTRTIVASG